MAKTIWVFENGAFGSGEEAVNKYPVVYENKTYYYCKQYGEDRLREFFKRTVEKSTNMIIVGNGYGNDADIDALRRMLHNKESNRLMRRISDKQSRVDQLENELEMARASLAKVKSELETLKTKSEPN